MAEEKEKKIRERTIWDECYDYFRYNLLGYDEGQSLSKTTVLRLKGMLNGKFIANNNIRSLSDYSFEVLLNTMKFSKPEIQRVLGTRTFEDEKHKVNYILRIVDNNLNTVYMRMKNKEKQNEKMKSADMSQAVHVGAAYQKKTKNMTDKFNDLW